MCVCVCVSSVKQCVFVMLLMALLTTPHCHLEQDMDHLLLHCCCSLPDNSIQLDHRSCFRSQLASGGE